MKITLTCTFPSRQSAYTTANLIKSSGYDIDKVSVYGNKKFANIKNHSEFYKWAHLPFTQNAHSAEPAESDISTPYPQIASISAALGFDDVINPFKDELPDEFSEYLSNDSAYMRCTVSSHQLEATKKVLAESGGENIKTYQPS